MGAPIGHDWAVTGETDSTCKVPGEIVRSCTRCTATERETKPLAAHTPVSVPGKAATCTATGLTDGVKCSVCGDVITPQTVIGKVPHSYGAWQVQTPATCTAQGVKVRECSVCHTTQTDVIGAKGHTDANGDGFCDECSADLRPAEPQSNCVCGQYHTGPFAGLIKFFHSITYFFKNLFK